MDAITEQKDTALERCLIAFSRELETGMAIHAYLFTVDQLCIQSLEKIIAIGDKLPTNIQLDSRRLVTVCSQLNRFVGRYGEQMRSEIFSRLDIYFRLALHRTL